MPEPELHVRDLTPPVPVIACDSGRHVAHPGETCGEIDELQAVFRAYFEQAMAAAYAAALTPVSEVPPSLLAGLQGEITDGVMATLHKAVDDTVYGNRTGDMRGFLTGPRRETTPAERAFAILEPHLHNVPLYRPRARLLR